jgi:uncharacterized protein (TIGR02001 family)
LHPAAAQLSGSVTLSSEARLRGRPVSQHRPVAELQLLHDSNSGFYLGGSAALAATRGGGLQPLSLSQYAGIVRRISPSAAIDLGIIHSGYTEYSGIAGGRSYTEAYVGVTGRNLSARIFLSPGYFRRKEPTFYAEVNGNLDLSREWALLVHAGRLTYLHDRPHYGADTITDWRVGLRRHIGRFSLDASWIGHTESERPYGTPERDGNVLVAALGLDF